MSNMLGVKEIVGVSSDLLAKLGGDNGSLWLKDLKKFLRQEPCWTGTGKVIGESQQITIPESATIQSLITAGNYFWYNENIPKNFSFDSCLAGTWEFRLIGMNGFSSSEQAKLACEDGGWQAGQVEHLLALGAAYPELQKKNPIIALGSSCVLDGYREVPALSGGNDLELSLDLWVGVWNSNCCFLSVRPVSAA